MNKQIINEEIIIVSLLIHTQNENIKYVITSVYIKFNRCGIASLYGD